MSKYVFKIMQNLHLQPTQQLEHPFVEVGDGGVFDVDVLPWVRYQKAARRSASRGLFRCTAYSFTEEKLRMTGGCKGQSPKSVANRR